MPTDYIGIDQDSASHGIVRHDPLRMLMTLINARYMYPSTPIEVRTTRKGFHIKIKKEVSVQEDIEVRRLLGDDAERLWYSEEHISWGMPDYTIDVLFNSKENPKRTTYTNVIHPI